MEVKERINKMKKRIQKNEKSRVPMYNMHFFIWMIIKFLPMLLIIELVLTQLEEKYSINIWFINLLFGIGFLVTIFLIYFKRGILKRKVKRISLETNVNKEEFWGISPGGETLTMGRYFLISYYVKEGETFRFRCKVCDDQIDLYRVIMAIFEKGEFPKLTVLVDPQNFNKYEALGYKFLLDTLEMNEELAEETLKDIYAKEWNYIC